MIKINNDITTICPCTMSTLNTTSTTFNPTKHTVTAATTITTLTAIYRFPSITTLPRYTNVQVTVTGM
jgi:hypothetical protein